MYLLFSKVTFENVHKNFRNYCFSSNPRKSTSGFYNFLKNRLIYYIFCNFLKKFFGNFQNLLASGGLCPPPDPLRGRPRKMFPWNRNPLGAAANMFWLCEILKAFYLLGRMTHILNYWLEINFGRCTLNIHSRFYWKKLIVCILE